MSNQPPYGDPPGGPQGYQGGGYPPRAGNPMNYALWADRVLAALIDGAIALAVLIVLYIIAGLLGVAAGGLGAAVSGPRGEPSGIGGLLGCSACCIWICLPPIAYFVAGLYNKVYLVAQRGYSIGQGVMKLKVVTEQGALVPTGTLVLRLLVTAGFGLLLIVPVLDLLWPLWDEKRQTLHDKAVGTFVIKEQ